MTIEEFRNVLMDGVKERLSNWFEVIPQDVLKNNGRMHYGICIREEGKNIAPTIYIEDMYNRYEETGNIDELIDFVGLLDFVCLLDFVDLLHYIDFPHFLEFADLVNFVEFSF